MKPIPSISQASQRPDLMRARYQDRPMIRRQPIFGCDPEKRSWHEPMKVPLYLEVLVERDDHWFSGPPHLRLDGLAGFVRILVSEPGQPAFRRLRGKRSAQSFGSRFSANVLICREPGVWP
jgi:hypothetical protein